MSEVNECKVCGGNSLTLLLNLPDFPLSETYGVYDPDFPSFDQKVNLCGTCAHVQLGEQLSAKILYTSDDYQYQSAQSHSSQNRFNSFFSFVGFDEVKNKQQRSVSVAPVVVDIGGNDNTLLDKFTNAKKYLIDPSIAEEQVYQDIHVIRQFVEEVNFQELKPEVVLCSHTLEHIADPVSFITKLLSECSPETEFFFEVPCVVKQLLSQRFDAFFHQHYHYFHPQTILALIERCGAVVTKLHYNEYPTCGGSVMFAFKRKPAQPVGEINDKLYNADEIRTLFESQYKVFAARNQAIARWLNCQAKVYGYGASLLLPVIFYHIGDAAQKIQLILDDDPGKANFTYKNLPDIRVEQPANINIAETDSILITSYENIPVLSRVIDTRFNASQFKGF